MHRCVFMCPLHPSCLVFMLVGASLIDVPRSLCSNGGVETTVKSLRSCNYFVRPLDCHLFNWGA